jgi:FAD/FMN-containing dehydrogenase
VPPARSAATGEVDADLAGRLAAVVGRANVLSDPDLRAPFEVDWTRRFGGPSRLVVRPSCTEEVAEVLRVVAGARVPLVTQGGNTGLVGGGVPGAVAPPDGPPVLLSTTRLSELGSVDAASSQITAGAGVTLGRLQTAAGASGLSFPVDLAARDSATVGGMVATNAGGLHVMRYGPMRAQVVGLEAVLADGTVISRLSGLVKDNTGYDLSQLMVGSEGTLGIVTAARLRLVPIHAQRIVALLGLPDTAEALVALDLLRRRVEGLQAAELIYEDGLEMVIEHSSLPRPLPGRHHCYLVVEAAGISDPADQFLAALEELKFPDQATAAAVDSAGAERLWAYRERHTEAISALGVPHKLDVTLPQARFAEFEREVRAAVTEACPGARLVLFGHVGDGNLHVNVVGPPPDDEAVDEAVLRLVASMEGSISAEHGIGRAKARWLQLSRSPSEIEIMKNLKVALDPHCLLNQGVLFAQGPSADQV